MKDIILNDFARQKNKEELEAVRLMKLNPLSYEDCVKQLERNTAQIATYERESSMKKKRK